MNYRVAGRTMGATMLLEAACLSTALFVALIYKEDLRPIAYTILILIGLGLPLYYFCKDNVGKYSSRGGFITVGIAWIVLAVFGALPFYFDGRFGNYVNCFFEAVSGFTTTGATVLTEIESLPRGILWWRSFTHFIGGMGVLVLITAIMPSKDKSHHLLKAEVPGPTSDKLVPKLSSSSKILYTIYVGLTITMVICLLFTGIGLYDAFTIAFGTAGTGGFCVKNASIAGYNNIAAEYVIAVFMLIFSVNFTVYFLILSGKVKQALQSEELRFFLGFVSAAVILMTINVLNRYGIADGFRYSFFTVSTIISTTGFGTVDYNLWPAFSKVIVVILMFCGACAGSTGGGLKMSRVCITLKSVAQEIKQFIHPRAVSVVRFDKKVVPEKTLNGIVKFFAAYIIIILCATLLVSLDNFDFITNFTAVLSCMSNIGPGLEQVGPVGNFSIFSNFSKTILSLCMLIGRLEIYPILILFTPSAWKKS